MLFCVRIWIILAGVFFVAGIPSRVTAAAPVVIINELMWMGSSASSSDEWIELRNTTDQAIDLSGWKLTKKSSGLEKPMMTIPTESAIPPGGIWLISHFGPGPSSVLAEPPGLVMTDVSLVNSSLQIKLYDAGGVLIDTADDGSGNPLAGQYEGTKKMYAAMERNAEPGDGTLMTSWHTASRADGFLPDAVERGTPGRANSNGLPVAEAGSDVSAVVGQAIQFDGTGSSDPEQSPLQFNWDFGDGQTANMPTPAHPYASAGTWTVTLRVSDGLDMAVDTLTVTISAIPPATPTTVVSLPPTPTVCRNVQLESLLPNPVGADTAEEIVLKNTGGEVQALHNCAIVVGTHTFKPPETTTIQAGKTLALKPGQSHLQLPNSGGTVRILDALGTELDRTTYGPAAEGARWRRTGSGWAWSGTVITKPTTTKAVPKKKTVAAKPIVVLAHVADLQALSSGERALMRGTMTAPVGALGERLAIMADETGAAMIILPAGHRAVAVGDNITATGTVRTLDGRRRLVVDQNAVRTNGQGTATPAEKKVDDLQRDDSDRLVTLRGVITTISGSRFEIDDGTDIISIGIKSSTGIVRPRMAAGDTVVVTGIVSAGSSGLRLYPRTVEDIVVSRVLGLTSAAAPTPLAASPARHTWWYWLAAGVGALVVNSKAMWTWWQNRRVR